MNLLIRTTFLLSLFLLGFQLNAQSSIRIKTYSFEEADSLQAQNAKPIFVYINASWCGVCREMERTTFQDATVRKLLNEKVYFISFDPENTTRKIQFHNRTYSYQSEGKRRGIHELGRELATIRKRIAFPTLVIINPKNEIIYRKAGLLNSRKLIKLLQNL